MPIPAPEAGRRGALHRVLPVGGALLFSPAALVLFDRDATVLGVPLLPAFLFGAWLVGIALTAWLARAEIRDGPGEGEG